ncbi:MAG: Crp/Fnr family transcriptional regulator [Armatimonadetes bacterium]|nr:Crp/Fnr family transcriptional regulator [Armatimonadota bacterium]
MTEKTTTFERKSTGYAALPINSLLRFVRGSEQFYRKGEILFLEGDPPKWLFIVKQGKVVLSKELPSSNKTIVSVRVPGDMVGEVAVFDGKPYDTDAIALTDVVVIRLLRDNFLFAIKNNPSLAEQVIADLASRLRQAQETICLLSTQRVEKRLAALLLALIGRFGTRTEEGIVLDSSFSRYDLAAMAGTTVETTVRTLSAWAQEGIIRKHRRQIVIVDFRKLAQIAREP